MIGHTGREPLSEGLVAPEVPGRTPDRKNTGAGLGDLDSGCVFLDNSRYRLEGPRFSALVTFQYEQMRRSTLGLATTQPHRYTIDPGSVRCGDDPIGVHHDCWGLGLDAGSHHGPVETGDDQRADRHCYPASSASSSDSDSTSGLLSSPVCTGGGVRSPSATGVDSTGATSPSGPGNQSDAFLG